MKILKPISLISIVISVLYLVLAEVYQAPAPSDIILSMRNRTWSIESTTSIRTIWVEDGRIASAAPLGANTGHPYYWDIVLYGQNNIQKPLKVDSVAFLDASLKDTLGVSNTIYRKNLVRNGQLMGYSSFNVIIVPKVFPNQRLSRCLRDHKLELLIYSNHGSLSFVPTRYINRPYGPEDIYEPKDLFTRLDTI